MRLFVAVDIPDELKQRIESDVVDRLRDVVPGARWTRPEGRHLTLKFLGDVDNDRVEEVAEAITAVSERHAPFRVSFADIGAFPNARRPRVLWIGLREGVEHIAALAVDLEHEVEALGFAPEGRPFRGHLTLARFPKPHVIEALPSITVPERSFEVDATVLYRSQLHPKGARYTALARCNLGASA